MIKERPVCDNDGGKFRDKFFLRARDVSKEVHT